MDNWRVFVYIALLASSTLPSLTASATSELHLATHLGLDSSAPHQAKDSSQFNAQTIARTALAELGFSLKISHFPTMRALQQANMGYLDGDLWRLAGTEQAFDNLLSVREPLCYASIHFYTLLDRTQSNYWQNMPFPKIILLPETQNLLSAIPKQIKYLEPVKTASISQALRALLRGDGNMILLPEGLIEAIEKEQKGSLPWVLKLHPSIANMPAHLLLNKRHKDINSDLSQQIMASKTAFVKLHQLPDETSIPCQ